MLHLGCSLEKPKKCGEPLQNKAAVKKHIKKIYGGGSGDIAGCAVDGPCDVKDWLELPILSPFSSLCGTEEEAPVPFASCSQLMRVLGLPRTCHGSGSQGKPGKYKRPFSTSSRQQNRVLRDNDDRAGNLSLVGLRAARLD